MDWLDRLSIAAIVVITIMVISMLANQEIMKGRQDNPDVEGKQDKSPYALQMEVDKKLYQEVISYKEQGRYPEAMAKLKAIMKKYPERSLSYVYMAQLYLKQGNLGDSIHNYRRAVEIEPDYVDKRTPLFIGDKIKQLVTEGRKKFGREKMLRPKDKDVRKTIDDIYYLQSRLAGGCE
jgi:tetratricopeptide (TPR) repeat protein